MSKTKVRDNLKEYIIKDVKSLLNTKDNFTKEEVNYLLACMYDRVRIINNEAVKLSTKILQNVIEFSNYLNLSEGGETSQSNGKALEDKKWIFAQYNKLVC